MFGHRGFWGVPDVFTMIAIILLAIFAMPFYGVTQLVDGICTKDNGKKAWGIILLVVSVIIFIAFSAK